MYHQPHGLQGNHRVILKDISILGDGSGTSLSTSTCPRGSFNFGSAVSCTPCPPGTEAPSLGSSSCSSCKNGYYAETNGTADCDKCGVGTSSTFPHTSCDISGCTFRNEVNSWDLTKLASTSVVFGDNRFELSVCKKVQRESMCFDENHKLLNTYSCAIDMNNGVATSRGRLPNVYYDNIPDSQIQSLRLSYTKGSVCSTKGDFSSTEVSFLCDVHTTGEKDGLSVVSEEPCLTKFQWKNIAGCRVCTSENYMEQVGKCQDNKQTVSVVRIADCNGPEVKEIKSQKCSASYSVSTSLALLFLLVFVALALGIVIISIRNKRLHDRYEMLVNESTSQRNSGTEASWGSKDDEKL